MPSKPLNLRDETEGRGRKSRPKEQTLIPVPTRKTFLRTFVFCIVSVVLLAQILNRNTAVIAVPIIERLWGITQECSFEIKEANHSLDGSSKGFDGKTASCQRELNSQDIAWTYTLFESSSLLPIQSVQLEIGFYVSEWQADDVLSLQASYNDGSDWQIIAEFNADNLPPFELAVLSYDLDPVVNSERGLDGLQIQLLSPGNSSPESKLELFIDEAALLVTSEVPPTETPTATETFLPSSTATATETDFPTSTMTPTSTLPSSPTETITAGLTQTETQTSTATPSISATIDSTLTPTSTETVTSTAEITPTLPLATSTPVPEPSLAISNSNQVELLWGIEQVCEYGIENPANSIDSSFNEHVALCTGEFAKDQASWHFTSIQDSSFTHISDAILDVRFAFSGWVDDQINLEIFNGNEWQFIDQFGPNQRIPPDVLSTLSYPVGAILSSPEALNAASVRFIGVTSNNQVDAITIQLDALRLRVAGGYPVESSLSALPTPSISFLALADAPVPGDPHGDHSQLADSCSGCHRTHNSQGAVLRQGWPEETGCFTCHSSAGPGTNTLPPFVNLLNTATRYFKHDVVQTSGIHQTGEMNSGNFGTGNRHIECEDCHDPHNAARGAVNAPTLPLEMAGIAGVDPLWNGPGAPASYNWLPNSDREYQVCFKCHSSFTSLPTYIPDGWNGTAYVANGLRKLTNTSQGQVPDSRDLAREFNPNQASFHPVIAQGRNQSIPAGSFVNGWSQTSMVYCTDCHNNPNASTEGSGPHGSPRLHILNGGANYSTVVSNGSGRVSSAEVCFQCHSYNAYVLGEGDVSNFNYHKKHLDNNWGTTCYTCHDTHGSEQLHLINFDASAMTFLNGRNSQTAWYYDPVSGKAGCFLSCHGDSHNPEEYTP
ncbi:MAG: hypothetical protein ACWGN2_04970 [Anaerolineales bacterium]